MGALTPTERRAMLTVLFAIFTDALLYSVVIPFLPSLFSDRLLIPPSQVQKWTSYSLAAFGVTELLSTWLTGYTTAAGNTLRPFLLGTLVMLVSTTLLFVPSTPEIVILARLLQGGSTAAVWVAGLGFMVEQVGEDKVGTCMGYVVVAEAFGQLVGPLVGGAVYEWAGHWAVFGIVEGCIAIDILLRVWLVSKRNEERLEEQSHQASETDALLGEQREENTGQSEGETAVQQLSHLWWHWIGNVLAVMAAMVARCALEATVPLFLERRFAWSSAATGAIIFGLLFPLVISPAVGNGTAKYGPRWFSFVGFTANGALLICLGALTNKNATVQVMWAIIVPAIGFCAAVAVHSQQADLSMSIKTAERLGDKARNDGQDLGWRLKMLRSGVMLSGLNTAWSSGEFLGPMLGHFLDGTSESWHVLCAALGTMLIVTGACCVFAKGRKQEFAD